MYNLGLSHTYSLKKKRKEKPAKKQTMQQYRSLRMKTGRMGEYNIWNSAGKPTVYRRIHHTPNDSVKTDYMKTENHHLVWKYVTLGGTVIQLCLGNQ